MSSSVLGYVRQGEAVCESELLQLGDEFAEDVLIFWSQVAARTRDHWEFLPFDEYKRVPVYKYAYAKRFCLVAVEDHGDNGINAWLMLAGWEGSPQVFDGSRWDGHDYNALRHILAGRLADVFR